MQRRHALLVTTTLLLVLCAACGVWLHVQQQRYALNRQLIDALSDNKTTAARGLLEAGADPNTRWYPPPAPTLKLLLNQLLHHTPPSVNDSPTALMMACGARWHVQRNGIYHQVAVAGDLSLLRTMLAHGANVHARALHKMTALHEAVFIRRWDMAELLLQHGADINAQDEWGATPLMASAMNSVTDVTHHLLSQGANVTVQNVYGETALHYAVYSPDAREVTPDLLAHGADPNVRNKRGITPLQYAQKWKHLDLVRLLKGGGKR